MRNRVESDSDFKTAEDGSDVVKLLGIVKKMAFESSDKQYPHWQAVQAWRSLMMCKQQPKEDLVDYHRRYSGLIEVVERAYGSICPTVIAEKDSRYSKKKDEVIMEKRNKFLAFMMMDGADKAKLGPLMSNLRRDFALGSDMYPSDPEDALRVLTATELKMRKADTKSASFAQVDASKVRCWKCKELGHAKKDCPLNKNKKDQSSDDTTVGSTADSESSFHTTASTTRTGRSWAG